MPAKAGIQHRENLDSCIREKDDSLADFFLTN